MVLRIRLLGGVELEHDGARLRVESGRVESLLSYLVLHRDAPQSRQHLAFLLWPDTSDAQARTNLRHVLHTLRRTLPDADTFLDVSSRTLQWRVGAPWELDVAAFDTAVESALAGAANTADSDPVGSDPANSDPTDSDPANSNPGGGVESLRRAIDLYRGELVPGCYDDWLLAERDHYRERYVGALRRLVAQLEASGDATPAISYAERLLAADPLDEGTYRALMRLHASRGDRARALRVYHSCTSTLERELGIPPSAATRRAYDGLLALHDDADDDSAGGRRPLGASPFVGRIRERGQLAALWRATEAGRGSLAVVTGEAGIGKTRLAEDFRAWCAQRGARTALARSYAAEGALAYGPVAAWLRSPALRAGLDRLDRPCLIELARLLPELLVEIPGLARPEALPESDQRHALFDAVARAVRTAGQPLLLIADDAHWCDRESLQLLHYLLRAASDARLLVVATARGEEIEPDSPLAELLRAVRTLDRLTEIDLARLPRADTTALAERLSGAALASADAERLWNETEGNPLFVVEAIRAGWPGGGGVSPKVQAVIESRLAQLSPPARELVGMAATIGRDFTVDLITDATDADDDAVVRSLDELWRRRLVREQGGNAYDFSHDKIRAVAYAGVSPIHRRRHHLRIARGLERAGGTDPGSVSAQVAAHYERAGAASDAGDWYARAAEAAQQLHANAEAVRLLDRAVEVLLTLPRSRDRDERELAVLTALPAPLVSVEGYDSPRLSAVHDRALLLADEFGTELAPPLLWSLAFAGLVREDFPGAERFAGELRERGRQDADDVLVVQGACLLGIAAFWQADFRSARGHLQLAVDRYRPEQRTAHLLGYGQDPAVVSLARLGNTLWFLGDAPGAQRFRDDALARADDIGHPLTTAAALVFAALLAVDMGDDGRVREYSAALAALDHEARPIRFVTQALAGYVEVLDGRAAAGLDRIRRALDDAGPHPAAPGIRAMLERLMLAAFVAAADAAGGVAAAERLLDLDGPGLVWAAEARRQHAALSRRLPVSRRAPLPRRMPGNG